MKTLFVMYDAPLAMTFLFLTTTGYRKGKVKKGCVVQTLLIEDILGVQHIQCLTPSHVVTFKLFHFSSYYQCHTSLSVWCMVSMYVLHKFRCIVALKVCGTSKFLNFVFRLSSSFIDESIYTSFMF